MTDTPPLCDCGNYVSRDGVRDGRQRYRNKCGSCRYKARLVNDTLVVTEALRKLDGIQKSYDDLYKTYGGLVMREVSLKTEVSSLRSQLHVAMEALDRVGSDCVAYKDAHTVAMESLERVGSEKAAVEERLEATREAHQAEMADKMAIISELSETRARQIDSIERYKSTLSMKYDIIEQVKSERDDYAEQIDSMKADYDEQIGSMKADCAEQIGSIRADYAELEGVAQSLADDNDELKRLRREDANKLAFRDADTVSRESLESIRSENERMVALRKRDTLAFVLLVLLSLVLACSTIMILLVF